MLLSYSWLARHVDLAGITPQQLVEELTLSTAEVESLEPFLPHLADITVGQVVQRDKHPDADKLSLCRVDVGAGEPLQIVCGAPNVRAGLKVAVATIGTKLPGDFTIKKSKIRGVESCGMICSERELGLGDEHSGIWELPNHVAIGAHVAAALGAEDWVFEIDNKSITHRPDLWGHRGMAREVAAIFRRTLKPLDVTFPPLGAGLAIPVRIDTPNCSRYLALAVEGARATPSPFWLKRLLLAVGQRPIDVLVDLSNFVMLDLGQPNHLFDRHRLSSEGIVVRTARAGERMTTLDGAERRLEPNDMLICSGDAPVALAGIMGGEGSKVTGDTSQLVLEVATFHPATVRRTSTRLGLRTDSSARFEKSLDPELPPIAAAHFLHLLRQLQPEVKLAAPITDVGEWTDTSRQFELRGERVRQLLGAEIDDATIEGILTRLDFKLERQQERWLVRVPSYRGTKDVSLEQDLVEEVGRIHRYGNIPERALEGALVPPPRDEGWKRRMLVRRVEDRLALAAHFHQTISYSFVHDALLAKLGLADVPHATVQNSIAEGFSHVRRSVVPSVLAVLEASRRRRAEVRLFEVGKGYVPCDGSEPRELHEVALVWSCAPTKGTARFDANSLARLQGVVDDVVRALGLEALTWSKNDASESWAHPGRSLVARFAGVEAAAADLAALEPGLACALGLAGELASDTAVARLSLDALLAAPARQQLYQPIAPFPETLVDVALALPDDVAAGVAQSKLVAAAGKQLARIELFDVYAGGSLGAGRKSLAWHVALRAADRTLDEKDVRKFLERVERAATELGGQLRRE